MSECNVAAILLAVVILSSAVIAAHNGSCTSTSDCFGLGDCVKGRCVCDAWASGAPDCSMLSPLPIEYNPPGAGYRNGSQPSWSGSYFYADGCSDDSRGYAILGAMTPGYPDRYKDYGEPELILVESESPGLGGPFRVVGSPLPGLFQSQVHRLPANQGGGYVVFSNGNFEGPGLHAVFVPDLSQSFGPNTTTVQMVYKPPTVDPDHPWICHTNDWGATILPDGSVVAMFRNGGRHCDNGSYPDWPAEQIGLLRASCWNCSDYKVITPEPLFRGLPSGQSNEDGFLWWSNRGIHMVLHSQDPSDPSVPHQVRGTVAFSPDIETLRPDSWVLSTQPAYNQTIPLKNGSALTALRRQRPQFVFRDCNSSGVGPTGWPKRTVTHLTNSVDLDFNLNEDGWGNAWALLQPLRQD